VNRLVKQYQDMARMMKKLGGKTGAAAMKALLGGGGLPGGMPGGGMPSGLPGGLAGGLKGGLPGLGGGLPGLGGKPSDKKK